MKRISLLLSLAVILVANRATFAAPPEKVRFTQPPQVVSGGKNVKISFALSAPTDVAVGIVDGRDVVVRHLAGGMLGAEAPRPLKAGSLSQTLLWDRTNDRGERVLPGKYRVRVRAGMIPEFERTIGYEPKALSDIGGLAVGPEGELFVINCSGKWVEGWKPAVEIAVFSRTMKYLRTILPWPGDIPFEKVAGALPVKLPDGSYVPRNFHGPGRRSYPGFSGRTGAQSMAVTPSGDLVFMSPTVFRIRASDGVVPEPFVVARFTTREYQRWGNVGVSSDGKWAYAACAGIHKKHKIKREHAVYRCGLTGKDKPELFAGKPGISGHDKNHFNSPMGVAADKDGNVYVADHGNGRIVVLSPKGKHLKSIKIDGPVRIAVDHKRGTIYVLTLPDENPKRSGRKLWKIKKLIKIKSWNDPQVLDTHDLPRQGYSQPVIALDYEAEKPILWIGNYVDWGLWRMVDSNPGGKLPEKAERVAGSSMFPQKMSGVEHVAVDPVTERLYVGEFHTAYGKGNWKVFDGKTGKPLPLGKIHAADLAVGPDGSLYGYRSKWMGAASVFKWDSSGKPLAFSGTGKNESERLPKASGAKGDTDREGVKGLDVAPNGDIYVMHFRASSRKGENARVCVLGPDGKIRTPELIYHLSPKASSPRLDMFGNLYLMEDVLPKGAASGPPELVAVMTEAEERMIWKKVGGRTWGYRGLFGSIVKFPPAGGGVYFKEKPAGKGKQIECQDGKIVENSVWIRPHVSPVYGEKNHWCFCFAGRFDIDRYGRIYVPIAPLRRIEVWDARGNKICTFGRYGNVDNGGKDSLRPVKGVPVNWGGNVAASDSAVYISDTNNRRVAKVRLTYHATATCPVPWDSP